MTDFAPDIFRIQRYSIHDGPGIRTTIFFQGCPLFCAWCHNPESQPMPGKGKTRAGEGGRAGEKYQGLVRDLVREIEKDAVYFEESGGGVTFSGGEPLVRPGLLTALVAAFRDRGIHTCLDTSGYAPFAVLGPVAGAVDLVLYDIKVVDESRARALTGRSPGVILKNLERLSGQNIPLLLRFPLIPGMTDTRENLGGIADFLIRRTRYRQIHLLPFHNTGARKYADLGLKNPMEKASPPGADRIRAVARVFEEKGLSPIIGG
ncbi:MAG: glycyl-radical enzyme activating protein [Desulfobacter sp.]|nr:MAG: glycyl-radical enzyme activating protein [Desulfobacter sp.]